MNETRAGIKQSIDAQLRDPIAAVLLKNSSLTPTQFETFLIQALSAEPSDKTISGEEKTYFRRGRSKISRGAFNRTLRQARCNIVRSLYTIFLLGYTNVFDTPELEPFIETASRIKAYATDQQLSRDDQKQQSSNASTAILEDLRRTLERLANGNRTEV